MGPAGSIGGEARCTGLGVDCFTEVEWSLEEDGE